MNSIQKFAFEVISNQIEDHQSIWFWRGKKILEALARRLRKRFPQYKFVVAKNSDNTNVLEILNLRESYGISFNDKLPAKDLLNIAMEATSFLSEHN